MIFFFFPGIVVILDLFGFDTFLSRRTFLTKMCYSSGLHYLIAHEKSVSLVKISMWFPAK